MSTYAGDGEPVVRYDEEVRRAKKARVCSSCRELIGAGDLYHRTAALFDGSWEVVNRCARCEAMYRFLKPLVRARDREDVCDPRLQCGHTWGDNFEGEPPIAVQALAFLMPHEAQALLAKRDAFSRFALGPWGSAEVSGPVEQEDARIARLLRSILGDRVPVQAEPFVAVPRRGLPDGVEDSWLEFQENAE